MGAGCCRVDDFMIPIFVMGRPKNGFRVIFSSMLELRVINSRLHWISCCYMGEVIYTFCILIIFVIPSKSGEFFIEGMLLEIYSL